MDHSQKRTVKWGWGRHFESGTAVTLPCPVPAFLRFVLTIVGPWFVNGGNPPRTFSARGPSFQAHGRGGHAGERRRAVRWSARYGVNRYRAGPPRRVLNCNRIGFIPHPRGVRNKCFLATKLKVHYCYFPYRFIPPTLRGASPCVRSHSPIVLGQACLPLS